MRNRLWGMRCYLIGAMDRVADNGAGWRDYITPFLEARGVVVLNPCNKPIDIGLETVENREHRRKLKGEENWEQLRKDIRLLRVVDLRMTDMSDFIICNLDTSIHACGTYEELTWANRLKRPILVHCEQDKRGIPDWLFGVLPHEHIFDTWAALEEYVRHVDEDEVVAHMKRWMFFDYKKMMPKVAPRTSNIKDWKEVIDIDAIHN